MTINLTIQDGRVLFQVMLEIMVIAFLVFSVLGISTIWVSDKQNEKDSEADL